MSILLLGIINGVRFDLATLALFFIPIQFLMLMPVSSIKYIKFFFFISCLIFLVIMGYVCGDVVFFGMFGKHITSELTTARGNIEFLIPYILKEYTFPIILLICVFSSIIYLGFKYIDKKYIPQQLTRKNIMINIVILLIVAFLTVIAIRGKINFYTVPLKVMDAEIFGNSKAADISLTGIFPAYEFLRKFKDTKLRLPHEEAELLALNYVVTDNEKSEYPDYPFMRYRINHYPSLKDKNIVIMFFESWDNKAMEDYPEAVKNFNKLKANGLYFDNFYSMGTRSLLGLTSFLFSIPYVPSLPYINSGLEVKNFSRMGDYFNRMGYKTMFIQTDTASAERMFTMAPYLGFSEFYSKENIPVNKDKYPPFLKGFDMEGFEFLYDKLNSVQGKSMTIFYTSSTHSPYDALLSEEHKVAEGRDQYEQFANRLAYADAGLGEFFDKASKTDWFNDTIFIMLPDHRSIYSNKTNKSDIDKFKSFMLIYAPGMVEAGINHDAATQLDILPTILDIAGSKDYYASLGSSVFDDNRSMVKFIYGEDGKVYVISGDEHKIVSMEALRTADLSFMTEEDLASLAIMESLHRTIINDKWMKKMY